jgi:hypothetical protein
VGGTLFNTIDGNGAITFTNAIINADVLKSGVFGANGTLTVGGGTLSGNTELKLYAPGSNGQLNFISNVTLNSESNVILAANTVTINNGVVVNITGDDGADALVFTNVPNYSEEFGGNDSTTGTFDGNGATTAPLDQAPPFDDASDGSAKGATATAPTPTTNSGSSGDRGGGVDAVAPRGKRHVPIARVTDSNELLDLVEKVASGPTETGRGRSRPATGKTLPGKGRTLARADNGARPDLIRSRDLAHRPAALP